MIEMYSQRIKVEKFTIKFGDINHKTMQNINSNFIINLLL